MISGNLFASFFTSHLKGTDPEISKILKHVIGISRKSCFSEDLLGS